MLLYVVALCAVVIRADKMAVVGYGYCRSPNALSITGEYKCLGGNDGCSSGNLTLDGGRFTCPGDDGVLGEFNGTIDDGHLRCAQTQTSYDNCSAACLEMKDCVGMEVTIITNLTDSNMSVGRCELHTVRPKYASEQVCETYNSTNSSHFIRLGYGVCQTFQPNINGSYSGTFTTISTYNLTDCQSACIRSGSCLGIGYTIPLDGDLGTCQLHELALSHVDPTICYKKVYGENDEIKVIIGIVSVVFASIFVAFAIKSCALKRV